MVLKLPSLNPQERMVVVVRPEDVDAFVVECNKENIDAVVVATVTENQI